MIRIQTLQQLFRRYRRPGDFVFATVFLVLSLFLLGQIGAQTEWKKGTQLVAQPAFWPAVSLGGMVLFGLLHWISSLASDRLHGRLKEAVFWVRSLEYALWFMAYVLIVPLLGYFLATLAFAILLTVRSGYRQLRMIGFATLSAVSIVVIFKTLLQVKVPGGALYELLPDGARAFMLTYF